jgi:hypothetical protein|tara:strand:+ start:896 stop:2902 length:2007 start_codon:yes stop_codon:yes gene_type:complete
MALGDEIKKSKQEAIEFKEVLLALDSTLTSLAVNFQNGFGRGVEDQKKKLEALTRQYEKDIGRALQSNRKDISDIAEFQRQIEKGTLATGKAQSKLESIERKRLDLQDLIENAKREGLEIDFEAAEAGVASLKLEEEKLTKLEEQAQEQEKQLGLVGKYSKAISGVLDKIGAGSLNKFFDLEKANASSKKMLANMGDNATEFDKIKVVSGNLIDNLDKGALAAAGLFAIAGKAFTKFLDTDQKIVDMSRNLSLSKDQASDLKTEMTLAGLASGTFGVTLDEQLEAVSALNKGLGGVALTFDNETRLAAAETLKRLKLSEEAVGNMGTLAMATGKSFEELEDQQIASVIAAEKELGIRLNLKDVLDEANKITGLARVNISKFPGGLAKAVSVAKSLGVEMDAISGAAGQLLDFEESIAKELEAELLIGRDLNLEAARQAALAGDQEALMRELVREAGSLEKLQGMNVIQQQALAGALGLSADQLANQVLNGEALATQRDEELARDEAEAEAQAKALSLQEKQAIAMQKMADIAGLLGPALLGIAAAAAAAAIAFTLGVATPSILTGIALTAAAIGTLAGFATMGDGTLPPGGPYAITDTSKPFGSTVITTRGDGIAVSPNIRQEGAGQGMAETNRLLRAALNRPAPTPKVNLDSIEIGTVAGLSAFPIQ